jgi:hypothetical protein
MQVVNVKNKELVGILDTFMDVLLSCDRSKYPYTRKDVTPEYATGVEYLHHMQSKKVDGFPEKTHGVDLAKFVPPQQSLSSALLKLDRELINWSGSRNNAVKMLYPKGGYMGWHHNANAAGYNLLLSWSQTGKGYFRYQDPKTKEIVDMHDDPGWTCKAGYFGAFHEPDKIFWHCANAEPEERFTLGYIIPHKGMWEDMIADIETT